MRTTMFRRAPAMARALVLLFAFLLCGCPSAGRDSSTANPGALTPEDSTAAIRVVLQFGERLQRVSLLAPDSLARRSIQEEYGDLVSPTLLAEWTRNVPAAPGRVTSSPWPDRIEVMAAAPVLTGEGAPHLTILGNIVERTSSDPSDGDSGRVPVRITVSRHDGGWRITRYMQGKPEDALRPGPPGSSSAPSDPEPADSPERAADALRAYYRAISEGRYRDAYDAWGSDGAASGQSFEEFQRGFAHIATVEATIGTPGRMEGAAGSRYVEIPVRVTARGQDGAQASFVGTYTMRRSVVDGATARQRAWHIHSAAVRRAD